MQFVQLNVFGVVTVWLGLPAIDGVLFPKGSR
jgi:hypothetical protein